MAKAFTPHDWGLLCMLDDTKHQGLNSFEATLAGTLDDGSQVYSGVWKAPKEDDDPRHFVIVEPQAGKTLVYWGTPAFPIPKTAWPWINTDTSHSSAARLKHVKIPLIQVICCRIRHGPWLGKDAANPKLNPRHRRQNARRVFTRRFKI